MLIAEVQNQQLKLERHIRELSILNRIAEALNREVNLSRALQTALEQVAELFCLKTGWVFLYDQDKGKFYTAATLKLPPALADHPRRMGGTCYCLDIYREGDLEGAANIDAIECSRLENLSKGTEGLRYHASIPLYAQGKTLGVLNVASTDWEKLSDDDLRLLHTVGDLMSIAIERAQLFQQSAEIGAAMERNRLAREIHDTIAQGLAAIALQLETADALLDADTDKPRVRRVIRQALTLTRNNLEEARRSVYDLRAVSLQGRTLPDALKLLVEDSAMRGNLEVSYEVVGEGQPLPTRIEVGLYRIAQEALNNVIRHAEAAKVCVQLTLMPDRVELSIEDDGIGFDPSEIPTGHFGLIGLNERAKLLGGKLEVCSDCNVGTLLEVVIPLDYPHE
jgi:two-component system NarL family sensor kinase